MINFYSNFVEMIEVFHKVMCSYLKKHLFESQN